MLRASGLALLLGLVSVGTAEGAPILIYDTGVDNGGTTLPGGGIDPHYVLSSSPYGAQYAFVGSGIRPSYIRNDSESKWIGQHPDLNRNFLEGVYEYVTTFDLAGLDPATAMLSGRWLTDNNAEILINGIATGDVKGLVGFDQWTNFTVTSGFAAGLNRLTFRVYEPGGSPTALRVEVSGTAEVAAAPVPVPEPGALGLLATGAVGLFGGWYRKRRHTPTAP